jgi:MFS family permease
VQYVWGFAPIRVLLIVLAIISLSGMPAFSVLMPFFGDALGPPGHGAQTMGFLVAASGVGALIGALYLTLRPTVVGLGKVVSAAAFVFGAGLIAFSRSSSLWLSLAIALVAGLGMVTQFAASNIIVQTLVDDEKRGRVMSFFTMAFVGMTPFGNIIAGTLATHLGSGIVGARRTVMIAGAICMAAAGAFAVRLPSLRRIVRPIYIEKGILPEVARGVESAVEIGSQEMG